jgi:Tfp pilus assembly protein PilN
MRQAPALVAVAVAVLALAVAVVALSRVPSTPAQHDAGQISTLSSELQALRAELAKTSSESQRVAASDASAKELARTAETTAETYATDHNGSYQGVNAEELVKYEPTITTTESKSTAWLSSANGTANGYEVTATAEPSSDTFTIKNSEGTVTRECNTASGQADHGCPTPGGSW